MCFLKAMIRVGMGLSLNREMYIAIFEKRIKAYKKL
jgi:hypothetical protein